MPIAFSRSMRSLSGDRYRRSLLGISLVMAILGAWGIWFWSARIARYETSQTARLEMTQAAAAIEASVDGRIAGLHMVAGQEVKPGQVLVELETTVDRLRLDEQNRLLDSLNQEISVLRDELTAQRQAQQDDRATAPVALQVARARHREAEEDAKFSQEEVTQLTKLRDGGYISNLQLLRAEADYRKHRALADALDLEVRRLELDQQTTESQKKVRLEQIKRELTKLQGEITTITATITTLQKDIEKYQVQSPVAGRVAELVPLHVGDLLRKGEKLGVVLPTGELKIVAQFSPSAGFGRIRPGQKARVRVQGFPWTQYGELTATVTNVAGETRDGLVRVELAILPTSSNLIPLQHGLPAVVEVEVEHLSPASLVLRSAGYGAESTSPATPVPISGGGAE